LNFLNNTALMKKNRPKAPAGRSIEELQCGFVNREISTG
jgi:hypothetical protein